MPPRVTGFDRGSPEGDRTVITYGGVALAPYCTVCRQPIRDVQMDNDIVMDQIIIRDVQMDNDIVMDQIIIRARCHGYQESRAINIHMMQDAHMARQRIMDIPFFSDQSNAREEAVYNAARRAMASTPARLGGADIDVVMAGIRNALSSPELVQSMTDFGRSMQRAADEFNRHVTPTPTITPRPAPNDMRVGFVEPPPPPEEPPSKRRRVELSTEDEDTPKPLNRPRKRSIEL